MKRGFFLSFCCCCMTADILCDTIGPVDYQLPPALRNDWDMSNKLEDRKSKTLVYTPKESPKCDLFFEAKIEKRLTDIEDLDAIRADLAKQFLDMKTHLDVIENGNDNLLYEWSVKENGHERIHGWSRLFLVPGETVTLTYQTDDLSNLDEDRSHWVQALKNAKK